MKMRSAILLICIFMTPSVLGFDFPDGWRLPTAKELSRIPLRDLSPTKSAKVEGDFNGDGNIDYAFLLQSTTFNGEGLAVRLSTTSGYSWQIVNEINWGKESPNVSLVMGISLAPPEHYLTACGKGYGECKSGEPQVLELTMPGIFHYRFESGTSVWFWDGSTNHFKQVWLSD